MAYIRSTGKRSGKTVISVNVQFESPAADGRKSASIKNVKS